MRLAPLLVPVLFVSLPAAAGFQPPVPDESNASPPIRRGPWTRRWKGRPGTSSASPLRRTLGDGELRPQCGETGPVVPPQQIRATRVSPVYPRTRERMSEPGQAIVTGSINEDGVVVGAAPISLPASEGPYRETAIYAFSLWRYAPAMQGGCPTSVVWTLTVNYRME